MPSETTPQPETITEPETITVGPFTWVRNDFSATEERWELQNAVEMIGMAWSCTNYGTKKTHPSSSFHGWRCGSGGPWPERYQSRDDAMNRVIPYLIQCMRDRVQKARDEVVKREAFLAKVLGWQFRNEKNS